MSMQMLVSPYQVANDFPSGEYHLHMIADGYPGTMSRQPELPLIKLRKYDGIWYIYEIPPGCTMEQAMKYLMELRTRGE